MEIQDVHASMQTNMQGKHASKQIMDLNMIWTALIMPKTVAIVPKMMD